MMENVWICTLRVSRSNFFLSFCKIKIDPWARDRDPKVTRRQFLWGELVPVDPCGLGQDGWDADGPDTYVAHPVNQLFTFNKL